MRIDAGDANEKEWEEDHPSALLTSIPLVLVSYPTRPLSDSFQGNFMDRGIFVEVLFILSSFHPVRDCGDGGKERKKRSEGDGSMILPGKKGGERGTLTSRKKRLCPHPDIRSVYLPLISCLSD